jgi:MFS family permease
MAMESASVAVSAATDTGAIGRALPKAPLSAWYGLFVLVMTTLFAFVDRQILNLVGPSLQTSLGFTDFQIGMLQGLGLAIFASVAAYPMGWLADRFGRRLILAVGIICWSLATGISGLQNSFGGLFLGTVGIAIGEAGVAPIIYAMIPDLFPERQRSTANFIFYGASLIGSGAGMAIGGGMLQWLSGSAHDLPLWLAQIDTWRLAMVLVALPGPLFCLLVLTMPLGGNSDRRPLRDAAAGGPAMIGFVPYARSQWRTLAYFFAVILVINIPLSSSLTWFPLALPRAFGIDPATIGVALGTAITIATLIGVFLPGIVLKLWRRPIDEKPLLAVAIFTGLAAVPTLFLPFATTAFHAYTIATIQGALGIAACALMPGLLQDLAPPHLRARVLAALTIATPFALAASPIATGTVSSLIDGPRDILLAMTIVNLPSLVAAAILISFARRPYASTVRAIRLEFSREQA